MAPKATRPLCTTLVLPGYFGSVMKQSSGVAARRGTIKWPLDRIALSSTAMVIPGWSEGPDLRCAIAHWGISRFRVRVDAPRNDESHLEQFDDLGDRNLPLREHEFFGFALPFAMARLKRILRGQAMFEDEPRI